MTTLQVTGSIMKPGRKLNRVHEMMTRVKVGDFVARVWSIAEPNQVGPDQRVLNILHPFSKFSWAEDIMKAIDQLGPDVVAAYEILDASGNGVVVYPDWK